MSAGELQIRFKHFTTDSYIPIMWNAFVIPGIETRDPRALGCISWNLAELKNTQMERDRLLVALQERIQELEKFEQVVIGRELKMIELEKELKRLKENSRKTG